MSAWIHGCSLAALFRWHGYCDPPPIPLFVWGCSAGLANSELGGRDSLIGHGRPWLGGRRFWPGRVMDVV